MTFAVALIFIATFFTFIDEGDAASDDVSPLSERNDFHSKMSLESIFIGLGVAAVLLVIVFSTFFKNESADYANVRFNVPEGGIVSDDSFRIRKGYSMMAVEGTFEFTDGRGAVKKKVIAKPRRGYRYDSMKVNGAVPDEIITVFDDINISVSFALLPQGLRAPTEKIRAPSEKLRAMSEKLRAVTEKIWDR